MKVKTVIILAGLSASSLLAGTQIPSCIANFSDKSTPAPKQITPPAMSDDVYDVRYTPAPLQNQPSLHT